MSRLRVNGALLERIDVVADELLLAAAVHEQTAGKLAEVTQTRQRAFTLFSNVYDHVRRAVTYLRWNDGDADTLAPSLYAGRKRDKGEAQSTAKAETKGAAPAAVVPEGAAVPPGVPGNSPFIS